MPVPEDERLRWLNSAEALGLHGIVNWVRKNQYITPKQIQAIRKASLAKCRKCENLVMIDVDTYNCCGITETLRRALSIRDHNRRAITRALVEQGVFEAAETYRDDLNGWCDWHDW